MVIGEAGGSLVMYRRIGEVEDIHTNRPPCLVGILVGMLVDFLVWEQVDLRQAELRQVELRQAGLWQVRLRQVEEGQVRRRQVEEGQVRLRQVRRSR
jgi:hypothetical protein